ncbi:unnamed protein product [Ilex paraguariensis]|uniref:Uncharacterized protein n=1 Tax=Ilex paraguariensis TaxID=185542 RepID=A0ABC8U308_9AQUA
MTTAAGVQAEPKIPSPGEVPPEVLHQRKKLPICPVRMAVGGFAIVGLLGYLTLYSKKKPEATAIEVAKVATGNASPENTHPRN